jgi:hypothetical protein
MFNLNTDLQRNINAIQEKQQEGKLWMDEIKELLIGINAELKKISEGK